MFSGYKVMITGATSGIGLATAKEFLDQGATVIGIGRNFEKTKDLGERFLPFQCDVTDEDQIKAAVAFAEEKFGMLDTLICNAASAVSSTVEDLDSEAYDYAYKMYMRGPALFTKYCIPLLRKSKNPSIAHTVSVAAYVIGNSIPYNTMKAALLNYSRQSAAALLNVNATDMLGLPKNAPKLAEGENSFIRVNAVCPGLIRTSLMPEAAWDALGQTQSLERIPSRRIGADWEVAKLYAFLASPKAGFITGATITIDGGWWATHARV